MSEISRKESLICTGKVIAGGTFAFQLTEAEASFFSHFLSFIENTAESIRAVAKLIKDWATNTKQVVAKVEKAFHSYANQYLTKRSSIPINLVTANVHPYNQEKIHHLTKLYTTEKNSVKIDYTPEEVQQFLEAESKSKRANLALENNGPLILSPRTIKGFDFTDLTGRPFIRRYKRNYDLHLISEFPETGELEVATV